MEKSYVTVPASISAASAPSAIVCFAVDIGALPPSKRLLPRLSGPGDFRSAKPPEAPYCTAVNCPVVSQPRGFTT